MMFPFVFFFLLISHVGSVRAEELKPRSIFLLAGQSNMSGRGGVFNDTTTTSKWDGIISPQCTPNTKILSLALNGMWEEAHEPLHKKIDSLKTCGVGPGMAFAHEILAKSHLFGAIGLVPCAKGGTTISEWQKGTELYNQLVDRARVARQSGGKIRALLWYQGESDCGELDSRLYQRRTKAFFNNVRRDLNSPDLPIILVVISSAEGKYLNVVRNAQLTINLKNVEHVDSMGSTFIADHKHLDTKSAVRMGQKLADKFLSSFGRQK